MSDLLRQSIKDQPPPARPRPTPINSIAETTDERPPSDSSSSSADSTASANTLRPSSSEQPASSTHWTNFFAQELHLTNETPTQKENHHVYLTPPTDPAKGPLFVCHHGAGASALSFALFWQSLHKQLPHAGILCLEARDHGSTTILSKDTGLPVQDFSIDTLAADAVTSITLTQRKLGWDKLPPTILIGHSLGGAVLTSLAHTRALGTAVIGFAVLDVVEGSALEALGHMQAHLSSRPSTFASTEEATTWHTRTRTLRNADSAAISVPSLFMPTVSGDGRVSWRTDFAATAPYWPDWFTGMSSRFLTSRGAKLLVLAGTDRLDKELMIGQMQGKFQLVVVPEAGHFVQEDCPARVAEVVAEFWRRNDGGSLVLPMKVDEMIRTGKKI